MTVSSTTSRNDYIGSGSTATYSYTFKVSDESHLLVTTRNTSDVETTLVLNTNYTVTGVGDANGGTIVLTAGVLASGYALAIRRNPPITQLADLRNQDGFYAEVHESAFDLATQVDQKQQDEIDRSLRLPETVSPDDVSTALPVPAASTVLSWNAAATALENLSPGSVALAVPADSSVTWAKLSATMGIMDYAAEVSVSAATTLTSSAFGKMHVCTGAADYTLGLPAGSGNTGKVIGIRVGSTSKLITIDGNAAETIDGSATRVVWNEESCFLMWDGSQWRKIGGKTRPMVCTIQRTASQSITDSTNTKVQCTIAVDDSALMADVATDHKITCRRSGIYVVTAHVRYANGATATQMQAHANFNVTDAYALSEMAVPNATVVPALTGSSIVNVAVGSYAQLYTFHNTGAARNVGPGAGAECRLSLAEIIQW